MNTSIDSVYVSGPLGATSSQAIGHRERLGVLRQFGLVLKPVTIND